MADAVTTPSASDREQLADDAVSGAGTDTAIIPSVADRDLPNYRFRFLLLILAVVLCAITSFVVGRFSMSIHEVVLLLLSPVFPVPEIWDDAMYSVVYNIRLPRILVAFLVGAALSTAGAAYQGMFQNPLVSPDILGASAGAGLGAALAIYLYLGTGAITIFAFVGGLVAVGTAYAVSRLVRGNTILSMVLAGILVGSLFSASISYIKLVADTNDQLPAITYWLMGSLASATMEDVYFAGVVIIIGIIPLFLLRWRMNVLTLGEDEAKSMGINTNLLRLVVIVCATLITRSRSLSPASSAGSALSSRTSAGWSSATTTGESSLQQYLWAVGFSCWWTTSPGRLQPPRYRSVFSPRLSERRSLPTC
ncbi:membrane protein of unknown function [Methanoculleus bourgensis]|uniref:Uncharacterized protein n=1 Tax=Methanoculleus bourgensis TaxID=83986 RepID=A0A0X3BK72_9EURY|nr:membrane protein of unknown function [Methanoculleus bourgensis]